MKITYEVDGVQYTREITTAQIQKHFASEFAYTHKYMLEKLTTQLNEIKARFEKETRVDRKLALRDQYRAMQVKLENLGK